MHACINTRSHTYVCVHSTNHFGERALDNEVESEKSILPQLHTLLTCECPTVYGSLAKLSLHFLHELLRLEPNL